MYSLMDFIIHIIYDIVDILFILIVIYIDYYYCCLEDHEELQTDPIS